MNIEKILQLLPHRYPLLLVDRVIELKEGESIIALKNVTFNEPQFQGHFPGLPVMPGVLIIEAMAQAAAILVLSKLGYDLKYNKNIFFMGIDDTKFRKVVKPGDSLYLHVKIDQNRLNVWKFSAEAYVDDSKVAESRFSAILKDKND